MEHSFGKLSVRTGFGFPGAPLFLPVFPAGFGKGSGAEKKNDRNDYHQKTIIIPIIQLVLFCKRDK